MSFFFYSFILKASLIGHLLCCFFLIAYCCEKNLSILFSISGRLQRKFAKFAKFAKRGSDSFPHEGKGNTFLKIPFSSKEKETLPRKFLFMRKQKEQNLTLVLQYFYGKYYKIMENQPNNVIWPIF